MQPNPAITRRDGLKLGVASVLAAAGLGTRRSAAAQVLRVGTLATRTSAWGQVFEAWAKAVKEKSDGALELQFFYNAQQGDDAAMVGKPKSGHLDGAALTGVGLGKVFLPILALQLPGLFPTWSVLDRARDTLKGDFERGARDAGFTICGWGNVGLVRMMSKGFQVHIPGDLLNKKVLVLRDDPIQAAVYQQVAGLSPVPLSVPEVLPNLNTGAINFLSAPALAAEMLNWSSKVDTVTDHVVAVHIGGLVFSSSRLDPLPAGLRQIVIDTARVTANALTTRIQNDDAAAMSRMRATKTVVSLNDDEKLLWTQLFERARGRLGQETFSPDLVRILQRLGRP